MLTRVGCTVRKKINYEGKFWGGLPSAAGSSGTMEGGRNCSADILVNRIPTPSIKANKTPPMIALPAIAPGPFLAARIPPVAAPLMIEFQGSSFFRMCIKVQSIVENIPPQTAKLPAIIGDRCLIAIRLPTKRLLKPLGAFRNPLMLWKTAPPIAPIVKAPPQSSTIRHGHGSLAYSSIFCKNNFGDQFFAKWKNFNLSIVSFFFCNFFAQY